jgi:hypothetical protein
MTSEMQELLQMLTWNVESHEDVFSAIDTLLNALPNKEGLPSREELIAYCMKWNEFD